MINNAEDLIPAIDLLEARMEKGEYLEKQDGRWHLFEPSGDGVVSGKNLRELLVNLIFMDC